MLALGGFVQIRHVGVPHRLAVAEAADRLAVHLDVGDDVDLRHALDEAAAVLLDRRPVEVAEPPAERDEVGIVERLAAKQQRGVAIPGLENLPEMRHRSSVRRSPARISAPSAPLFGTTSIVSKLARRRSAAGHGLNARHRFLRRVCEEQPDAVCRKLALLAAAATAALLTPHAGGTEPPDARKGPAVLRPLEVAGHPLGAPQRQGEQRRRRR